MTSDEEGRWRALVFAVAAIYDALDAHGLVPIEEARDGLGAFLADGLRAEGDSAAMRRLLEIHQVICRVAEQRRGATKGPRPLLYVVPTSEPDPETESAPTDGGTPDDES